MCSLSVSFSSMSAMAQKKDSTWIGQIEGTVMDSAHDYELPSATVAMYFARDSGLIGYQLSDNGGRFQFKQVPVGVKLHIVVSYMGYKTLYRSFLIDQKQPTLNFQSLNMELMESELPTVEVTIPPVRLNGDTLEFNAGAFKLDPAAQTEDLLRMLPGITVWNDGSVTVNGKPVTSVLVNGKPFFGGDTKVATQNIPKDAVDKIQVYKQKNNSGNPLDSIIEINIKLLKNKQVGYFGKLSVGGGTDQRYETDASMNFFSRSTQLAIAGGSNNVNKVANDVNTILRNSTFKGIGANIEYQPELSTQGANRPNNGGLMFQHDFIPDPGYFKVNRLLADYFIKDLTTDVSRQTQTSIALGGDSGLLRQMTNSHHSRSAGQMFNTRYDKQNDQNTFSSRFSFRGDNSGIIDDDLSYTTDRKGNQQSSNRSHTTSDNTAKILSFETKITHRKSILNNSRRPGDYELSYNFRAKTNEGRRVNESEFIAFADASQYNFFHRYYDDQTNDMDHTLLFKLGDISPWVFGFNSWLSGINMQVVNDISVNTSHAINAVKDRAKGTDDFIINSSLTNKSDYSSITEMPGLSLSRNVIRGLDNRYQKSLSAEVLLQAQFYEQRNTAIHLSQNFTRRYEKLIPGLTMSYVNNQFGAFQDFYSLGFNISADYPTVQQLVPLTDSVNQYNLLKGNVALKPADRWELYLTMNHRSLKTKNPFNYTISITAGTVKNFISDVGNVDSLGRREYYFVNLNSEEHIGATLNVNKAFKFFDNQLELSGRVSINLARRPNIINYVNNITNVVNSNNRIGLAYTYGHVLSVNLSENWALYKSRQLNVYTQVFNSHTYSTLLSASVNCTGRLAISSNATYNNNVSTNAKTVNFLIWNASSLYRIGKEKNVEVKLSALDLLHQNRGVSWEGNNNMLTYTNVNVLQQYFAITLSFFPRKFGRKKNE